MPIYLGDNNITSGFTTAEKKQFNNSINLINEQLDTLASQEHSHANKTTLDKLGETDGKLTFGGNKIDFEIPDGGIGLAKLKNDIFGTNFEITNSRGNYPTVTFTIENSNEIGVANKIYIEYETDSIYCLDSTYEVIARSGGTTITLGKPEITKEGNSYFLKLSTIGTRRLDSISIRNSANSKCIDGTYKNLIVLINEKVVNLINPTAVINGGTATYINKNKNSVSLVDKEYVIEKIKTAKNYMVNDDALESNNIKDNIIHEKHLNNDIFFNYISITNNRGSYVGFRIVLDEYLNEGELKVEFYLSTFENIYDKKFKVDTGYSSTSNIENPLQNIEKINSTLYKVTFSCTVIGQSKRITLENETSAITDFNCEIYGLNVSCNNENLTFTITAKQESVIEKISSRGNLLTANEYFSVFNPKKKVKKLPYPRDIYTVKNDEYKNNFAMPLFIDYVYDGSLHKILYKSGLDRSYLYPLFPNKTYYDIFNKKVTLDLVSDSYEVEAVTVNNIGVRASVENKPLFVLTIGDSVTAGAVTSQQYWSVCAEMFAREDIQFDRTSNVLMLGSNNTRTVEITEGNITKEVKACASGVSSWKLQDWIESPTSHFSYEDNGTRKFSILKWIERYRTHDDNGNKLELGQGTGTEITSANIDEIQCCTPNVVYINSTHNEGSRYFQDHLTVIETIRNELPNCVIILGTPMPQLGTWNPELYTNIVGQNIPFPTNKMDERVEQLKYWENYRDNADFEFYLLPQIAITPTGEGYEFVECNAGAETIKMVTKTEQMAEIHPGYPAHKIWGNELYAILKYISAKRKAGVITNFNEVPLT